MKKNSQIHFFIETEILNILKRQANEEGITLSKLCRERLREQSILIKIYNILENLEDKVYKSAKS